MITGFAEDPGCTIEPEALERLHRLGGARLVRQMIDLFEKHAARHLTALQASDTAEQVRSAELAAHSIKTSAGNLGATRLYDVARRFEEAAVRADLSTCRDLRQELAEEFARTCEQLACIRSGLKDGDEDETDSDRRGQRGQSVASAGDSRRTLRSA